MKFAKVFEQALKEEDLPQEWLDTAIQYKALKKRINKVVTELENIGLEKQMLSVLFGDDESFKLDSAMASYQFDQILDDVKPKLIISVKKKDHLPTDDATPDIILENLNNIVAQFLSDNREGPAIDPKIVEVTEDKETRTTQLVITMAQDSAFFHMLYQELKALDDLKSVQEQKMIGNLNTISQVVSLYTSPTKRKSDIYVWREIFKEYIDSEIFFSTSEFTPGERGVDQARIRLALFFKRITDQGLLRKFRHKKSTEAFYSFYSVNSELLKALQYQEYNKLAITKILKKFDKQTALKAKSIFPKFIAKDPFITYSFSHTICEIIGGRLLNIVPQLEDYTCPICCSVAFKPIRLDCGHVFCVRCLVKMQRKNQDHCPLCRADVVLKADENNLDQARLEYLKLYFPKETKEKQQETEREIAKEQYEAVYGPEQRCCIQ